MNFCMSLSIAMLLSSEGGLPRRDDSLCHALAAEPRWPECLRWGDARVVRAQGAERLSHSVAYSTGASRAAAWHCVLSP